MKQKKSGNRSMQTASLYRRRQRQNAICIILRIILTAGTLFFVWFVNLSCAWGWIKNARAGENWPPDFVGYGQMMIAASVLLTAAAVLVLFRRNWIALGIGTAGIVLCLIPLFRVAAYAAESGFYSRIMDMPVDKMYYIEILPTGIVYICIAALSVLQHTSVDAKAARIEKKLEEERPVPSVFDGK